MCGRYSCDGSYKGLMCEPENELPVGTPEGPKGSLPRLPSTSFVIIFHCNCLERVPTEVSHVQNAVSKQLTSSGCFTVGGPAKASR